MMKDNDLLMVVIAFVIGFMLQGMMKNMCGQRMLMEGKSRNQYSDDRQRVEDVIFGSGGTQLIEDKIFGYGGAQRFEDELVTTNDEMFGNSTMDYDTNDMDIVIDNFIPGSTYMN